MPNVQLLASSLVLEKFGTFIHMSLEGPMRLYLEHNV